jgi:hypothetical protein
MVKAANWLSITPEPERELPEAVAALAHGGTPSSEEVAAEAARLERLVLHGTQRQWLRYLHAVVELIDRRADDPSTEVRSARSRAVAVLSNHHNLLLGLPGRGAQMSATDRRRLTELDIENHEVEGQT